MKRTLRRFWQRVRIPEFGRLYYVTHVSEYFIVQVWREGASWRWVAAGFPSDLGAPIIAKHGSGATMNEAQWYAEQFIPEDVPGEQLLWLQ